VGRAATSGIVATETNNNGQGLSHTEPL